MSFFTPKGFYILEQAVWRLARELDAELWKQASERELSIYTQLGEATHARDLSRLLRSLVVEQRASPQSMVEARLKNYENAQSTLRLELHAGKLIAVAQFDHSGTQIEIPAENWASSNAPNWFADSRAYIATGGTRRFPDGLWLPWLSIEENTYEIADGLWATILIGKGSLSDLLNSDSGPTAEISVPKEQNPKEVNRGGRPAEYNWGAARSTVFELLRLHGLPGPGNPKLVSKSDLAAIIANELATKLDQHPSPSNLRKKIDVWLSEFAQNPTG